MIKLFKNSYKLLNSQIKDIMKFFMLIIISSIFGSFVFPVGGFVLSIGIFIYATQVILKFTKTRYINIEELEEPFYKGIIESYGFKLLLTIPIIIACILSAAIFLKGAILTGFSSIYYNSFKVGFLNMFKVILKSLSLIILTVMVTRLISPFADLVFLDEDFRDKSFFKKILLSFKLANGYRLKVLLLLISNCIFIVLSIFTFGLALIYFYPLYLIMLSNLYIESKTKHY